LVVAKYSQCANSKANQLAQLIRRTCEAANIRDRKATKAMNLKQYMEQTKLNLDLQTAASQAKSDMIEELSKMKQEEKINLFFYLLDENRDGNLKAQKIADAIKLLNSTLTNKDFFERVQSGVQLLDDPYLILDPKDFHMLCQKISHDLDSDFNEFGEFLILQVLFAEGSGYDEFASSRESSLDNISGSCTDEVGQESDHIESSVEKRKAKYDNDDRMRSLFFHFDRDGDSAVDFKEIAIGLHRLTSRMDGASKKITNLLLMMDQDDKRELNYDQFSKLIIAISVATNQTFEDLADDLILNLTSKEMELSEDVLKEIMIADDAYEASREKEKEAKRLDDGKKVVDALTTSRARSLFNLWDSNADGLIDFQELLAGLSRYQKSHSGTRNMAETEQQALLLIGHDHDKNQSLDEDEFALAMINYAERMEENLHELIDFMVVISSQDEKETDYEKFLRPHMGGSAKKTSMKFQASLGTIPDFDLGEFDSDEEDDF